MIDYKLFSTWAQALKLTAFVNPLVQNLIAKEQRQFKFQELADAFHSIVKIC